MSAGSEPEHRGCGGEERIVDREQIDGLIAAAGVEGARDILRAFWRSTDHLIAALKDQLSRGDLFEASRTAHSLKGSALNVGALQLSLFARSIEEACKAEDRIAAQTRLPAARDCCARAVGAYEAVFAARS